MSKLILLLIFFLQDTNSETYSQLTTPDQIESSVVRVWDHRGATHIILNSGEHFWIPHSRNYEYRPTQLSDFIQVSDFIVKKTNSDTLQISRNSNVYTFVIGEFLNEHLSTATKINLNFAFKLVILFGLFILMFGSYTRTTVLLTWNDYKVDRSLVNNIKNAIELISSGHAKRKIFIFLLTLFFSSTLLFIATLISISLGAGR